MPLLDEPVLGTLAGDRQAVELARDAHGEVAHVDHLLDFSFSLGEDLPRLESHEPSQVLLSLTQRLSDLPDDLSTPWRWDVPPRLEREASPFDDAIEVIGGAAGHACDRLTGGRVDRHETRASRLVDPGTMIDTAVQVLE